MTDLAPSSAAARGFPPTRPPPDPLDRTRQSLRSAGIVCLAAAAVWGLYLIGVVTFGLLGGTGQFSGGYAENDDVAAGILVVVVGGGYFTLLSGACLAGGIGLLKQAPWGRTAGLVAAVAAALGGGCGCVFSLGLAAWLFILLTKPEARQVFEG